MSIQEKIDYLFSKINWGASNMDAKAVEIMNTLKSDIATEMVIHVKGGLVQWAIANGNIALNVIDSDVDGSDPEDLTEWTDKDGDTYSSNVYGETVVNDQALLSNIVNSFEEE